MSRAEFYSNGVLNGKVVYRLLGVFFGSVLLYGRCWHRYSILEKSIATVAGSRVIVVPLSIRTQMRRA